MTGEPRSAATRPTIILITDPRWPLAHIERAIEAAASALDPGALQVQLRDKTSAVDMVGESARRLRAVTSRAGAMLVVNAPSPELVDVAIEAGADGLHVPCLSERIARARARLGAQAWISTPAHTDEDVTRARGAGASAVLVSPVFETPGKGPARGIAALVAARALGRDLPIYALGGIDASRAAACAETGVHGVAVIRAILGSGDPAAAARALAWPFIS